jgi:hypothetical protein
MSELSSSMAVAMAGTRSSSTVWWADISANATRGDLPSSWMIASGLAIKGFVVFFVLVVNIKIS